MTCRCRLPVLKVPKWLELSSLSVARNEDIQPWSICGLENLNSPGKRVRFVWNYLIMYIINCVKKDGEISSQNMLDTLNYLDTEILLGSCRWVFSIWYDVSQLLWNNVNLEEIQSSVQWSPICFIKLYNMPMDADPNTPIICQSYVPWLWRLLSLTTPCIQIFLRSLVRRFLFWHFSTSKRGRRHFFCCSSNQNMSIQVFEILSKW